MSINKMIVDCMKREKALALKERKKTNAYHQRPLWVWLRGVHNHTKHGPKIHKVLNNECRWPWHTLCASGEVFVKRVCEKKSLPWIQKNWLLNYVAMRYQGHYKDRYTSPIDFHSMDERKRARLVWQVREIEELVDKCLAKAGIERHKIPLRLILSSEFSCLIQLKLMEKAI